MHEMLGVGDPLMVRECEIHGRGGCVKCGW